jgi:uncharacterized membrane protein
MTALVLLFVGSGMLLLVLSVPMMRRMLPPNYWYGVRLPRTLRDERLWYDANAFGGKCLFGAGLIWTAGALLFALIPGISEDTYAWLMLILMLVVLGPAFGLIFWYVYRR